MNDQEGNVESQMSRMTNGSHTTSRNTDYLAQRLAALGVSSEMDSEDGDIEMELQDFSDDTGSESSESSERGPESNTNPSQNVNNGANTETAIQNGVNQVGQLVHLEEGDEEIDSDEERDLLKEIREEIQNKVKEEMKEEIQVYKAKIEAIEQGAIPGDEERKERKEEEENLDPRIHQALEKMRKLDRILMKKMKREREVKRDRILLERRIREEINNIKPEGREHKDVVCNTEKFVALALPPSHNEGVPVEPSPATPVFQTQLNETEFQNMRDRLNGKTRTGEDTGLYSESSSTCGDNSSIHSDGEKKNRRKKKKDFIKRNKELAANADEAIAMTEEERKRVGELLNDLDSLPELPEEMDGIAGDEFNPFQMLPVLPGEGYYGDELEVRSMAQIDDRLKHLLPEEEFNSLVATPHESARDPQHKLFTHVDIRSVGDIERYGERALLESKEQRDMQARLQKIEEQLARFNNPEEIEIETPRLSEDAMKGLIDQCVRSLSRSSYADNMSVNEDTPRSEMSSVVSVLENPPHLSDEVLQKLLAEAHFPLSSKLEALQEEEEKSEMDEEDGQPEPRRQQIRAETWKAIAESEVYENGHSNDMNLESFSRTSSQSTLRASGLFERQYSDASRQSVNEYVEPDENRLVLPDINQSPFLVSQGLNNQLSKNETYQRRNQDLHASSLDSITMVRNNLSESNGFERDTSGMIAPRPPSSDRRSNTDHMDKSRTCTPLRQS